MSVETLKNEVLRTEHLTKIYRMGEVDVVALRDVNFAVRRGEFVAIMGASGSGKSTLLHLLGGLDTPTEGEVYLNGQALSKLSDDQITLLRRQKIGFIFQFYNLLPTLNAVENVALPLMIDGQHPSQYQAKVTELLHLVRLEGRETHRPDQLSGGQQQRVAIARAFVNQPEIVLADEPTGNLDSRSGKAILELLKKVCKEFRTTVVMVTHDPKAASYADRVVFLKDGQILNEIVGQNGRVPFEQIMDFMAALEA
ncbi:MAG: ABC transporter ATP-binding protein [Anaerolineales bacterium]|nr:ABC transporter ATP-binding protein [Anaerolineales bacterium]MCS7248204.1 ABC transporter ATP-binding protein [Anaerolineales bacterium]MDW8162017.1 ABC transporter ATP-binding protein [Anaerolineales bacterium]MDW8448054.1 ABC transporter ATP-binding protein [Anaerolineales bacterium]